MAYINVDYSKFPSAVNEIDSYILTVKSRMKEADNEINTLSTVWQGSDFAQYKAKWDTVTDKDSTYMQMLNALESYSKFLKYACDKYKETQAKAVNRANSLPR